MRTPGWEIGASSSCKDYTPDQHLAIAKDLLDAVCDVSMSEDAWDGEPPHRMYTVVDSDDPEEADYAPLLAALVHVGIALAENLRKD